MESFFAIVYEATGKPIFLFAAGAILATGAATFGKSANGPQSSPASNHYLVKSVQPILMAFCNIYYI